MTESLCPRCWRPEGSGHLPICRATCAVCRTPFTDVEWENRHSGLDGEDVHEQCCEWCPNDIKEPPPSLPRPIDWRRFWP